MTLEEIHALTPEALANLRYRCKTDLFFLGTEILDYDFTEEVHRAVCDFFVHKDPAVAIEDLDVVKDRLLLDPREHYKTTVNAADTVQWIITYPDIRVSIWSGEDNLAKQIMTMVKNHFLMNEKFRALFFEHALDPKDVGSVYEFTTPARTAEARLKYREPTLSISTIKSVSTGGHFNVIKYDDVVTPQNSENKDQLAATIDRVRQTHPLLIVGGYRDFIGTRYDFSDLYGHIYETADESWKIFKREAYSPSVDAGGVPIPPSNGSSVLFAVNKSGRKAFDYKELLKRYREMGPRLFGCQYLNNPAWGESSFFPEELLKRQCIPMNQIPLIRIDHLSGQQYKNMILFIVWDLAFSKKKEADYTVGMVGGFDSKGRIYVIDMVRGRFNADEFTLQFFTLLRKWMLFMGRVGIEETAGAPLIEPSLRAHAASLRMGLPIDWLPVKRDTSKNERVFGLLPLLKSGKLFFNNEIPEIETLIKEFNRFPRYRHDDIPDACSMLLQYQKSVDIAMPNMQQFPNITNPALQPPSLLGYGIVG